jgi:cytochrome c556
MKIAASILTAAAVVVMASPASAQFAKPEDAIKYRQSVMFMMSQHVGRIGAMVNGKAPYDAQAATDNAALVAELSKRPWHAFVPGSDKGAIPTRAKTEIWIEQQKFKENQEKLVAETAKLLEAAKTNNLDNLKAAFGDAGKACKGCHDNYRKDEK